jgi:hypothetical protein
MCAAHWFGGPAQVGNLLAGRVPDRERVQLIVTSWLVLATAMGRAAEDSSKANEATVAADQKSVPAS